MRPRLTALAAVLITPAVLAAELPVRSVVLYKNGVGYFQRAGTLAPGEAARLEFKAGEMNDVLKSLTVRDKAGGAVRSIRYDASEPFAQRLAEYPFKPADRLSGLLDQAKGARISVSNGSETVTGTIVGARTASGGSVQGDREQVNLLLDGGELRTVELPASATIRFADAGLQRQFADYLQLLLKSRSTEKRTLTLESTDAKARDLTVSYMAPFPAWKTSYRLILEDGAQGHLEGWAIVDNTSGDDWNGVGLALVSGRPVSFISPIYEPRYVARPVAQLAEDRAVAPMVLGSAIRPAPAAAAPRSAMAPQAAARMAAESVAPSSVAPAAEARELGDLFEYRIPGAVTVRRGESAMFPFVQQKVAARKLSFIRDGADPMHVVEMTNATPLTLDGGPVTVFDRGAYAGEALMDTLKAGDKRHVAYGRDLGLHYTTHFESGSEVQRSLSAVRGVITSTTAVRETRTYGLENVDARPKTVMIEQYARPDYRLVDRTPSEKTSSAYRFEVALAAKGSQKFAVVEERILENTIAISSLSSDGVLQYARNKTLTDAGRRQLEEIAALKAKHAEAEAAARDLQRQITEGDADQERTRRNISSLNSVAGQQATVQAYAKQLAEREEALRKLRADKGEADKRVAAAKAELDRRIEAVKF